jgi:epoxyqueuosine reductase
MELEQQKKELSLLLVREIKRYCFGGENAMEKGSSEKLWDEPLIGFANGGDPLFDYLKKDIGSFLWTPMDIFTKTFPGVDVSPEKLTVISWILPQTRATRADQRKETEYPSKRWAITRFYGEKFNTGLRRHVVDFLKNVGFEAVAPLLSPHWEKSTSRRYGFASTWSERHAAYAAGLGTFGLCDGLITPVGKAMRCGSVVANIPVSPTARPYEDHHAYCLFYSNNTCRACAGRCPAGAISENGHDKAKCFKYIRQVTAKYVKTRFGIEVNACGLCQTGIPCESQIPDIE